MSHIRIEDQYAILAASRTLEDHHVDDFLREVKYRLKCIAFPTTAQVNSVVQEVLNELRDPVRRPVK